MRKTSTYTSSEFAAPRNHHRLHTNSKIVGPRLHPPTTITITATTMLITTGDKEKVEGGGEKNTIISVDLTVEVTYCQPPTVIWCYGSLETAESKGRSTANQQEHQQQVVTTLAISSI